MNENINDGGPAFPFGQISELTGQPINGYFSAGMTKREWFTGMALQGILACPTSALTWQSYAVSIGVDTVEEAAALRAIALADAVIAATASHNP